MAHTGCHHIFIHILRVNYAELRLKVNPNTIQKVYPTIKLVHAHSFLTAFCMAKGGCLPAGGAGGGKHHAKARLH